MMGMGMGTATGTVGGGVTRGKPFGGRKKTGRKKDDMMQRSYIL